MNGLARLGVDWGGKRAWKCGEICDGMLADWFGSYPAIDGGKSPSSAFYNERDGGLDLAIESGETHCRRDAGCNI